MCLENVFLLCAIMRTTSDVLMVSRMIIQNVVTHRPLSIPRPPRISCLDAGSARSISLSCHILILQPPSISRGRHNNAESILILRLREPHPRTKRGRGGGKRCRACPRGTCEINFFVIAEAARIPVTVILNFAGSPTAARRRLDRARI